MPIETTNHTQAWVFVLFFALLTLGNFQSKSRSVSRGELIMLPLAMIALSFYGVFSAFGIFPVSLAFWVIGVAIAVGLGVKVAYPKGVTFSAETQSFFVPSSWLPFVFMMAIFFTKYAVSMILARQLPIASETSFVAAVSLFYGLFSGVFLARSIVIWHASIRYRT